MFDEKKHYCKCCGSEQDDSSLDMFDSLMSILLAEAFIDEFRSALEDAEEEALEEYYDKDKKEDKQKVSITKLLYESEQKELDKYLDENYKEVRQYIDEEYAALLMLLARYEKVDFDKKLKAHIVQKIKQSINELESCK